MSNFGLYSQYYDALYDDKDYEGEVSYLLDGLVTGDGPLRLLELGCGTGAHAQALASRGHHVTGIDLSAEMLTRAEVRRQQVAPNLPGAMNFHQGDIRTWRGAEQFDAVLSLFHVMSYQTTNQDLAAAFATAAHHLPVGGRFVFDYWFGPAVLSLGPSVRVRRLSTKHANITRIAEPRHIPTQNTVLVDYDIMIEDNDGHHERISERHAMRYLFVPEIEAISAPFFTPVRHLAWMTQSELDETSWAGVSVLERKA